MFKEFPCVAVGYRFGVVTAVARGHCHGAGLVAGLGTSTCCGFSQKKKKSVQITNFFFLCYNDSGLSPVPLHQATFPSSLNMMSVSSHEVFIGYKHRSCANSQWGYYFLQPPGKLIWGSRNGCNCDHVGKEGQTDSSLHPRALENRQIFLSYYQGKNQEVWIGALMILLPPSPTDATT